MPNKYHHWETNMNADQLADTLEQMYEAYETLRQELQRKNPRLYERWKSGGYLVSDNVVSHYPTMREAIETLIDESEEDDDDE